MESNPSRRTPLKAKSCKNLRIYEQLGVKKVINCVSTSSSCGSSVNFSPRWPEVFEAMKEASRNFVCINQLQEKAGKIIAEITGAEAAIVTSGCAAALTLAAAACMTKGTELERVNPSIEPSTAYPPYPYEAWSPETIELIYQLPDTKGLKNEIIQQRCTPYYYTRDVKRAGAKVILVGKPDKCSPLEIEEKISKQTSAILFVGLYRHKGVPFEEVVKIAKKHKVPIIFDGAYTLPPKENLRKWISMGADLVCHSGGKIVRGPSDTGWLCGRKDLVKLAWLQISPHHGVGRGFKVDRTQIVALVKSLQIYVEQDEKAEFDACEKKAKYLENALNKLPHIRSVKRFVPKEELLQGWPVICLTVNEETLGMKTSEVVDQLFKGNPGIWTYYEHPIYCPNGITINTENIANGEEKIIIERFKSILTSAHST